MTRVTLSELTNQINTLTAANSELTAQVAVLQDRCKEIDVTRSANNALRADNRALEGKLEDLQKKLKNAESNSTYWQGISNGHSSELDQAHAVLDSVEGAPSRTYEVPSSYGSNTKERNVVTRLAGAFLSIASAYRKN
jgi:predicted RNase H-like nuclease (RuvC/YqgF family)